MLRIKDNGIGIADSDLSRIFSKGFTGNNGRKYAKSTGMGLYLCKQLCGKMHLNIYAESEIDKGTIITIVFPKDSRTLLE